MPDDIIAGLADSLTALRMELTSALVTGKDDPLKFQLNSILLEMEVVVTKDAGADGGVRFGVVSFGAKGSIADAKTHKLTLSLQPITFSPSGQANPAAISGQLPGTPR
jgi:Trypsin-co-occurring domain 2